MRQEFEDIRQTLIQKLLREARWDPQSHDREGMDFVTPLVGSLIDALEIGDRRTAMNKLTTMSGSISTRFNELGYYRSTFSGKPLTPEAVETCIRTELDGHFSLPPRLTLVG